MEKLGINFIYLVAQIVNFGIVFFLLKRFLYKPLLNLLDERRRRVEENIRESERVAKKFQELELKEAESLSEARRNSQRIIEEAKKAAAGLEKELLKKARQEAEEIIKQVKISLGEERKKVMSDIEEQAADMVVAATRRILEDVLDESQQHEIIKRVIADLKKEKKLTLKSEVDFG